MRRRIVSALLVLLMMFISIPALAAGTGDQGIAKLDLALTPTGQLVIPLGAFEKLPEGQRGIVGDALRLLNQNSGLFTVESNTLKMTSISNLPEGVQTVAAAWDGKKVDIRSAKPKEASKENTDMLMSGEYYWFNNVFSSKTTSHVVVSNLIHSLAVPEHNNAPYNTIGCTSGHTNSFTGSITFTSNLNYFEVSAATSLSYSDSITMNCNTSYQRDVAKGTKCDMYWSYLSYTENQYWNRWYYEDWNADGVADYTAYWGQEMGYVHSVSGGSFDYSLSSNPCQQPCAGLLCPYR